jgi:hypothetical protein
MTGLKEDRPSEGRMSTYTAAATFDTFGTAFWADHSARWFDQAKEAGFFHKIISILTRRSNRLLDLNSYPIQKRFGHSAGQQEVPLDRIRGTEGRLNDFDDCFHPLNERSRERWVSVARANDRGVCLPPIDLIQVDDIYFVRDGHHRVSVARAFGQTTISANVTVW